MLPVLALVLALQAPSASESWQQDVHYTIEASLDDPTGVLSGAATMVYHNRSPDTLGELFFHLHLNAFRPGSIWARVEQRPNLQFGGLRDPDFAYERLTELEVDGSEVVLTYPHAPDSTVVRAELPTSLAPGDSLVVTMSWEARASTMCRRQCRRGRHVDFAQWYPRIAPYDAGGWQAHPLYPQGEFYGEFGTYDVTLDLASDQVVGATGVVLSGDPGWRPTVHSPEPEPVDRSGFYTDPLEPRSPGKLPESVEQERKRVRFYAEDVHHFAWSADPAFRYEGGRLGETAIHVLFLPGDVEWDLGNVVRKAARSLGWLEEALGPYPWPQLTIAHRLDGGGTEFPMFIGNGGASQGLVMHEAAHQYAHGILANNEWKDAWLDEGMASFLTNWFMEDQGVPDPWSGDVDQVARREARGVPVPVATLSEDMPDFSTYGHLAYTKPSVVLRMLRNHLGRDVFGRGLRVYYERNALQHVTEDDLRSAMEAASEQDLDWFFDQWIHTTATLDYAVAAVRQSRDDSGQWVTAVEVRRSGEAWMPVRVLVGERLELLTGSDVVQTVTVVTDERPTRVLLDPGFVLPDIDRSNNVWQASS